MNRDLKINSGNTIKAKVAILLCVKNGESFLREQMCSYFSQEHTNWELWVSDDGSTDATRGIIGEYADRGKRITLLDGPCLGVTENFLFLTQAAETDADYFAWSDHDDIWLPDKLTRAVRRLDEMGQDRAALYCGRTMIVDSNNRFICFSPIFSRPPDFRNAMCQNIGGGNTMVFNRKARKLLCSGSIPNVFVHDWWAYLLVTGSGGAVWYDPSPCLRYRQHEYNLIGSNNGWMARLFRLRCLFRGDIQKWSRITIAALRERRALLTPENARILEAFAGVVEARSLRERFYRFHGSGVFRQTFWQNAAMYAAVCLRKYP